MITHKYNAPVQTLPDFFPSESVASVNCPLLWTSLYLIIDLRPTSMQCKCCSAHGSRPGTGSATM